MAAAGHSRVPVTVGHHLDRVLGIVHWGSVVDGDDDLVGTRVQPALMLPDTVRLSEALRRFREERQQMAIVVDEHGSVDGIVTLEDLLEEVVGEIWDETDPDLADAERVGRRHAHPPRHLPGARPARPRRRPRPARVRGLLDRRRAWSSRCSAGCPSGPATSSRWAAGRIEVTGRRAPRGHRGAAEADQRRVSRPGR